MFSIDSIKKCFRVQHISLFIIGLFITVFLFLPIIVCHANSSQDLINLREVGACYGLLKEVKILEINDIQGSGETNRYAFCITSTGMVIFEINNIEEPSVSSFTHIAKCNDIEIDTVDLYAYVVTGEGGKGLLKIFNVQDPKEPFFVNEIETAGNALSVAITEDGYYAYIACGENGLQIVDISDRNYLQEDGNIPGFAQGVLIVDDYAYVYDRDHTKREFVIIDISDKNDPKIDKKCNIPGFSSGRMAISDGYAYVTFLLDPNISPVIDPNNPPVFKSYLGIIPIHDPNGECPDIQQILLGGNTIDLEDRLGMDIAIKDDYAYVADVNGYLRIIDISKPERLDPIIGSYKIPVYTRNVAVEGDYVYLSGRQTKLTKLKIDTGYSPKGNLILVAGGNIDYESPYWHATQSLANQVFCTFIENGYEAYEIYYHNPFSVQDIDNDGIPNQLVVDYPSPSCVTLKNSIKSASANTNTGPLYIYLIGHGGEDHFQIMPKDVITASELKMCIDMFQDGYEDANSISHPGTNRQVVVIIESADSGTFIDDLIDDNITVITSTGEGASYIKPDFSNPNTPYDSFTGTFSDPNTSYKSFTSAFIDTNAFHAAIIPNLDPEIIPDDIPSIINDYLAEAFTTARDQLESWALEGPPFVNQAPQMVLPENIYTTFYFSEDGNQPIFHLHIDQNTIDPNSSYYLTIIGRDTNSRFTPLDSQNFKFFSSDQGILDTNMIEEIEIDGILRYGIIPERNGRVILKGYADPENNPNLLLSAKLIIEVSVKDPNYAAKGKIAVIIAGSSGSGDYLWESTNEIGKHAYQILREMDYTKGEIYYYNPYFLQDLDNNGRYDEIRGYPHMKVLDPNTTNSPFEKIGMTGAKEFLLFFVDHGSRDAFYLNPNETFSDTNLVNLLDEIGNQVDERIIFLYDACYSGSFLEKIKEWTDSNPNSPLINKLITITSTDPDETAYFLNQGIISFSYPFFDEWLLTHSILDAFDYAGRFLPGGQTPQIFDPNLAEEWDKDTIYYPDESRPVIDNVQAYRSSGGLHIEADIYAITGIKEVRAIIGSAKNPVTTSSGRAITEAPVLVFPDPNHFSLYGGRYIVNIPDPCPNETNYLITIFAKDNSKRPKTAFYKTAIVNPIQNKTKALIIASDPTLFLGYEHEQDKKIKAQVDRAKAILEYKDLEKTNENFDHGDLITIRGEDISSMNELPDISSLAKDQILFIYLIGKVVDLGGNNNTPCFYLNPNLAIDPNEFAAYMPQDTNQRLLILMDAPYAGKFLKNAIAPDNWPERWAGIASTDQGDLFFPIDPNDEPFPCFSNFFFSGLLSGATVAEAYRLAEMAVSLTRQRPEIFLPEQDIEDYETINRYLGYYLGASAVPGEEEPLLIHCRALAEEKNGQKHYQLFLTPHPDANIIHARAVLTSPTSTLFKKSMAVDLNQNGLIYTANKESGINYYKALFMVKGGINGDDSGRNWTDWQEVPIASSKPIIINKNDRFEPDNDPNFILRHVQNEIIVNTLPDRHRFYNEYTDWAYFYALEGHIYEISAQDLSIYDYFIRIKLYDPNMNPINGEGGDKNFLIFICRESGYYRLEVKLGATYPDKGVGYILSVIDPKAGKFTSLLVEVFNPRVEIIDPNTKTPILLRSPITVICEDSETHTNYSFSNEQFIYPDSFCYKLNYLPEGINLEIKVYQGDDYPDDPSKFIKSNVIETGPTKYLYIDLTNLIDPNKITIPDEYWYDANDCKYRITYQYPWDANNPLPFGDMDPNFPPEGDYDGDGLSNHDEISFYESDAIFPTIPLYLCSGMNIFYFPSVIDQPNVKWVEYYIYDPNNDSGAIYKDTNQDEISYYYYETNTQDTDQGQWHLKADRHLNPNQFNAIYTKRGGILYLDLKSLDHPVLCLRGFLDSNRFKIDDLAFWLDSKMINPYDFDTNVLVSEILKGPDLWEIESITSEHLEKDIVERYLETGSWDTSYRFFGRPSSSGRFSEKDVRIMPYRTYFVHRNKERMP